MKSEKTIGILLIIGAVGILVPYTVLTIIFDYPDILRQEKGIILTKFHEGGNRLIWNWWALFLSVWGLVGYAIIFLGMLSETMGSGWGLVSSIPGGLWEVFIGVWLIVKGFNTSALESRTVKTEL